jgi:hypothetical protein
VIDLRIVTKFVRVPPSHRLFTKNIPQRLASSKMASCAWRFVPTNRMFFPCAAASVTNVAASRKHFSVFWRSMM